VTQKPEIRELQGVSEVTEAVLQQVIWEKVESIKLSGTLESTTVSWKAQCRKLDRFRASELCQANYFTITIHEEEQCERSSEMFIEYSELR